MTISEKAVLSGVLAMFSTQHTLELLSEAAEFDTPATRAAGAFVLANRDAPAQAIAIELALKKLGGSMKPDAAEVLGWSIFRHVTLAVHDHLQAEAKAAAEAEAKPAPVGGYPGDKAMQAQPGGFDAAGFSPRR